VHEGDGLDVELRERRMVAALDGCNDSDPGASSSARTAGPTMSSLVDPS
jgi:hypothetical protein